MSSPQEWKERLAREAEIAKTPEYADYERRVIEEGVRRQGEESRLIWESFSFESEFCDDLSVEDCIDGCIESMDGE